MSAAVAEIIGAEFVEAARTLMPKQVVESLVAEILRVSIESCGNKKALKIEIAYPCLTFN
jgi:hypothetical protein